ncbi:hypothetical protein CsatB_028023 [Cannabis sativa]
MSVAIESAPELEYVCYEGNINFCISLELSDSLNGKFVILEERNYDTNWFNGMRNFLKNLNCSWNMLTLHVHSCSHLARRFEEQMSLSVA